MSCARWSPRPVRWCPRGTGRCCCRSWIWERITVNDIMIPRQEISGIDVTASWEDILDQLRQTLHTRLPVYEGELDNILGVLHMKRIVQELARESLTRERLIEIARSREPYFVPEGTPLTAAADQLPAQSAALRLRGQRIRRHRWPGDAGGHPRGDRRRVHHRRRPPSRTRTCTWRSPGSSSSTPVPPSAP